MPVNKKSVYGEIQITDTAIASLVGTAVSECYGVVGVTAKKMSDSINDILKRENYGKGVLITNKNSMIIVDLYLVLGYGVKISEVVSEVQKRVKYTVEKALNMDVKEVNVHVEGIKVI